MYCLRKGNGIPLTKGHTGLLEINCPLITLESPCFSCGECQNINLINPVLNNSHPKHGLATWEGRDYQVDLSAGSIEKYDTVNSRFETISYGDLNPKNITKVAYGSEYILILDNVGNVWAYEMYDGPIG